MRSQFNNRIDWYRCPVGGGKLYIPGYTGALHCPDAATFCDMQTVSGIKYPETILWLEWLFWAVVFAVPASFGCVCLYDGPRRWLTRKSKRCCGAVLFVRRRKLSVPTPSEDSSVYSTAKVAPPRQPAYALLVLNAITAVIGAVSFSLCVYYTRAVAMRALTSPFLALALYVTALSVLGMVAAFKRAHGVSSLMLLYFFLGILCCILLLWGAIWAFAFSNTLSIYVSSNWDVMSVLLSCCYDPAAPLTVRVATATKALQSWLVLGGIGALIVFALFLLSLVVAGFVAKRFVLLSTTFFVFNHFLAFAGVLATVVTLVLIIHDHQNGSTVAQVAVGVSVYIACVAALGLFGVMAKRPLVVAVHAVLVASVAIAACVGSWYAHAQAGNAAAIVARVSASTLKVRHECVCVCV